MTPWITGQVRRSKFIEFVTTVGYRVIEPGFITSVDGQEDPENLEVFNVQVFKKPAITHVTVEGLPTHQIYNTITENEIRSYMV